ncbi:transmembrane protein 132B-like [Mercenaria mercenaria]|uniref:transmembrane protein 132B-like n=1 Tax=Mercenaria mercenaria TaxID=6596 RepID=UPI00234E426B|nr:transmembrane protein 132B-like [Mercenaria mercenaria]
MPKKRRLDPFLLWIIRLYKLSPVAIRINQPHGGLLMCAYSRVKKQSYFTSVAFNLDVSAHIVSKDISPKIPKLQVLVHASPFLKSPDTESQRWCAQIFADALDVELSSVCIINERDHVCVASLDLHKEWWTENSTSVKVSYSFNRIDQNDQCASASNAIIPGRSLLNHSESGISKQEITTLHLTKNKESFDEWKDQDILIDVPREMFHQSDTFEIPIRLEKNSDLQIFVMRARVRQGLRITGARMTDPSSQWSIHVDIKEHQKTGTVTAFVRDAKIYKRSMNGQELFRWQMEVAEDTYDSRDRGRVVWSIEYQQNGMASERYLAEESKIVSQINIRSKDHQRLVPVLKVTEIVNVAILTGWEQVYPLQIYAVDDTDKLTDVTQHTKCHSVEVDVLKVASDCTSVFVDGAESRGSHNVTIIAKNGQTTAFIDVAVWVPEERLDIQLSDTKLSRVKNWRVPGPELKSRSKRASDPYVKSYYDKMDSSKGRKCELLRQQSLMEVFARFYIQTPKSTDFFMGPGTYLKITDLVKGRLRMSDTRIAKLSENVIKGVEEGCTEIQLLSPRNGHVLAMREICVSHDKVSVKQLKLKLVTGMTMFVDPSRNTEGALVATAVIDGQFLGKNHEGIVDVEIVFSDMTTLPLRNIAPEDYFLQVIAVDHNIVGVAVGVTPPYQPHVVANGEGEGELLSVKLRLAEACERKKTRPLITTSMFIHVDFSQERRVYDDNKYQMDAHYDTNRASDRWDGSYQKAPVYTIDSQVDKKEFSDSKFGSNKMKNRDDDGLHVLAIKDDIAEYAKGDSEAKQEPLRTKTLQDGLTPLEIGMYVLLAVFCVAMTVFMVNCVVFFVRYKRKQKPTKAGSTEAIKNANDWVWIGRATLERNSVYTRSSRTLMPEEDFNGNVNSTRPLSVGSNSSSGSSQASTSGISSNPSNSNRNSVVSTYKGSECSIRITTNPLTEEGAMGGVPEETVSECGVPQWDYEAMGMNYDQLLAYFDNLKESTA